ncbi:MAG: malate synthase A [Planctomycetes bacterium]|nr:malate synthase A [Planctomycetota bacterium]
MRSIVQTGGVEIAGALLPGFAEILSPEAIAFILGIERRFHLRRMALLRDRRVRQAEFDRGVVPDFLLETAAIRCGEWRIAPVPADLADRRVEITGPVDRKMIINGLNSGARVFMADFEDATSPTWNNVISGQIHLRDAIAGAIEYTSPAGRRYRLEDETATLMVRPRGWHLDEKHIRIDGRPASASIVDFGLYFFHNARALIDKGTGPYFYLPKLEGHEEARLWNEIFCVAQDALGIPRGTIKATVLIETLPAAFEMDEILYELRAHSAGLNCGRWDYIFSAIKKFRADPERVFPDRAQVSMTTHFLRSYSRLLVQTCHRRGAHAIGGMAAQIPIRDDEAANAVALEKVAEDKRREVRDGHDGTWVAHPGLIPVARAIFDAEMPGPNQIDRPRSPHAIEARDLLAMPEGTITEAGLRTNLRVCVEYLAAWLLGQGCVPLYNLMEDAATAEIARAQVWQWIRHPRGVLPDGRRITQGLVQSMLAEETKAIRTRVGDAAFATAPYPLAASLVEELVASKQFVDFLTIPAYEYI